MTTLDADFPLDYMDWPDGGVAFAIQVRQASPTITFDQMRPVADRLFGSPAFQENWGPARGQDANSILGQEGSVFAMGVQAWSDRADWALTQTLDDKAAQNYCVCVRVMKSAVRYHQPDGDEGESGDAR